MPLEKLVHEGKRAWALWKLSESEELLSSLLSFPELIPSNITNPQKRLEWLAGRILTQRLLEEFGVPYRGIVKNEHGKPFPAMSSLQLSLSHSYPYAAAIVDREISVGIDLEQPKSKLLRVAPRVLGFAELQDAGTDLVKHCVYWCSKEALIKIHGKKNLILAENLVISPFALENEGTIIGKIIVRQSERLIPLYYKVFPGFVLVFNQNKD